MTQRPSSLLNAPAPAFALPDQHGTIHTLAEHRGTWVVLYCYPKDMTPGCTVEACDFRDNMTRLTASGAVLYGLSADSVKRHAAFAERERLSFPLLADEQHETLEAYGVWQEKRMMGKRFMGISRTTFLIDPKGIIRKVYENVKVNGHVDEVLQDFALLQ